MAIDEPLDIERGEGRKKRVLVLLLEACHCYDTQPMKLVLLFAADNLTLIGI